MSPSLTNKVYQFCLILVKDISTDLVASKLMDFDVILEIGSLIIVLSYIAEMR